MEPLYPVIGGMRVSVDLKEKKQQTDWHLLTDEELVERVHVSDGTALE